MIWIALLLVGFLGVALGRRASARKRHALVLVTSIVTLAAMYVTFGGG